MPFIGNEPTAVPLTSADIQDGTITLADLSATGTASASTFLRGDNTWQSAGGTMTPAFMAFRNTNQSIPDTTMTKIQYNSEIFDTNNAFDNSTNYRFTPQVAGKYFIFASLQSGETGDWEDFQIQIYKNGTSIATARIKHHYADNIHCQTIVEMNGTTDYVEAYAQSNSGATFTIYGNTVTNTNFGGYKIIE